MGQVLHGCARTTATVRRAIQSRQESLIALAERYDINPKTVHKWRKRSFVSDAAMGPQPRSTTLSAKQEAMIVAFRKHTLLPLDDCLYALQATLPQLTRSSLHRWFQRHLLDQQPVSLVGRKSKKTRRFRFSDDLRMMPVLLPGLKSSLRAAFDLLMDQAGIRPIIAAEVDDMAMLRLLARESTALALVPRVVVKDELKTGILVERYRFPQIKKNLYAITPDRRFPNPLVKELLAR